MELTVVGSGYIGSADALIQVTERSEFRTPDFELMETSIKYKIVFDGRNLFDVAKMKD